MNEEVITQTTELVRSDFDVEDQSRELAVEEPRNHSFPTVSEFDLQTEDELASSAELNFEKSELDDLALGSTPCSNTESDGNSNSPQDLDWDGHRIVEHAEKSGVCVFKNQYGEPYVWIPSLKSQGLKACIKVRSQEFLAFLYQLINTLVPPEPSVLQKAARIFELKSHQSKRYNLSNRYANVGNKIFIDRRDSNQTVYEVSSSGSKEVILDEPRFYQSKDQLSLPEPESGGEIESIFEFIPGLSENEKLLLISWLLSAMCPFIPTPILLFVGPQGSAKTTRTKILRSLIDPSRIEVLGEINKQILPQICMNHAVPCFENVSQFSRGLADMLCQVATGSGIERRKLFTDSEQFSMFFQSPIIINGIDVPSTRPDFLDRCIIIECQRLQEFSGVRDLQARFELARPKLFGALLDKLAKTLQEFPTTEPSAEFRMAEFATFGRAVSKATGKLSKDFDDAYLDKIKQQETEALDDNPTVKLLELFADKYANCQPWKGTAGEILNHLSSIAKQTGNVTAKRSLPGSPRWMGSLLKEIESIIERHSIRIRRLQRTSSGRLWEIQLLNEVEVQVVEDALKIEGGENNE